MSTSTNHILVDGFVHYQRRQARNTEQPKEEHRLQLLNIPPDTGVDEGTGGVPIPKETGPHAPQTDTLANGAPPVRHNIPDHNEDTGVPKEQKNRHPTTSESAVGPSAPVKATAQDDWGTPNLKKQELTSQDWSPEIRTGPPGNSAGAPSVQGEISSAAAQNTQRNSDGQTGAPSVQRGILSAAAQNTQGNSDGQTGAPSAAHNIQGNSDGQTGAPSVQREISSAAAQNTQRSSDGQNGAPSVQREISSAAAQNTQGSSDGQNGAPSVQRELSSTAAHNIQGNSDGQTGAPSVHHQISATPNASSRATEPPLHTTQNIQESESCLPQTPPEATRPAEPSREQRPLPILMPSDGSEIPEYQGQGNMSPRGQPPQLRGRGRGGRGGGRPPRERAPAPSRGVVSDPTGPEKRGRGGRGGALSRRGGSMLDRQGQQTPIQPSITAEQTPELVLSESKIRKLEETIRDQEEQISQLKAIISHLHRREGDPPKADRELAIGFSDVARSIEQLVLQHCRTPKDPDIKSYCPELRAKLQQSSCQPDKHLRSGQKVWITSAVLARLLCERVFDALRSDLVGSRETTRAVQLVVSKLKGTPYQHNRWRAVTVGLLTTGDDFVRDFNERVGRITGELGALLSTLAPSEDDNGRRMDALRVIVEQTSKLAIEIRKQTDQISLNYKDPGSPYDPQCMEEVVNCCYSDAELEELRATVQIQIFPAIMRRPCEWDGNTEIEPTVVLKAKVMAEPPPRDVSPEGGWQ